jgi:N6-adenosine-specific RNA methylase IME4
MSELTFHPLAELFPLIEGNEFDELVADIRANGIREPIWICDGQILDGRNRYRGSAVAGVDCPMRTYEGTDPLGFVVSLNLKRRHLNESQRAMVTAKITNLGKGQRADRVDGPIGLSTASAMMNVGERSAKRARVVLESGVPALARAVERGDISVSAGADIARLPKEEQEQMVAVGKKEIVEAYKVIRQEASDAKKERRQEKEQTLAAKILAMPETRFGVIYADPPWKFTPYSVETGLDRAADNHYPTTATDNICSIDVPSADDAALFLWATAPMLPDALKVMSAWGFTYKSHIIWGKDRIGTGYWARNKHELLLIGTRGEIPAPAPGTQPESLIMAPLSAHSVKPDVFHEIIERIYPTVPKLEMFARRPRDGWTLWGYEAPREAAE